MVAKVRTERSCQVVELRTASRRCGMRQRFGEDEAAKSLAAARWRAYRSGRGVLLPWAEETWVLDLWWASTSRQFSGFLLQKKLK